MTTSAMSSATLDASELERIDRFTNVGLVHIQQLSALCRLLSRTQPDDADPEQGEADFSTVVEGMLPLLNTVQTALEEVRAMLPQSETAIESVRTSAAEGLNQNGTEIPAPLAVGV